MKRQQKIDLRQPALPHDTETEVAVLSTLMRYNERYAEFADLLDARLFYYDKEQAMFRCIEGVISDGGITDVNSLWNYAQTHDTGYELFREDFVKIITNLNRQTLEQDINRLRDMSRRRECWKMLMQASAQVLDLTTDFGDDVDSVITSMGEVQDDTKDHDVASFGDALDELEKITDELQNDNRQFLETGIRLFDDFYLLRPGTLTVIAAFTSVGKTALAINITQAVARQGIPVAYYSKEMRNAELASRAISKEMNIPASVMMNRKLSDGMRQHFKRVVAKNRELPIYFDDRSVISWESTVRSIRQLAKTKKIKLAMIDYLQVYSQTADDEEKSIAYMIRSAKNVANELQIPVVVLSQLNRSALHPSIKMLRGSGQIEESSDNVVLIDRPDAYPDNKVTRFEGEFKEIPVKGLAKLILAKGRGVGTGSRLVRFDGEHTTFSEIEKPEEGKSYEHDESGLPF